MPRKQIRHRQTVGHITFETLDCPRGGKTFAIYPGNPDDVRAICSGPIDPGMAAELLKLSAYFRELERDLE